MKKSILTKYILIALLVLIASCRLFEKPLTGTGILLIYQSDAILVYLYCVKITQTSSSNPVVTDWEHGTEEHTTSEFYELTPGFYDVQINLTSIFGGGMAKTLNHVEVIQDHITVLRYNNDIGFVNEGTFIEYRYR